MNSNSTYFKSKISIKQNKTRFFLRYFELLKPNFDPYFQALQAISILSSMYEICLDSVLKLEK